MHDSMVTITVQGGIADIERCPAGVDVEIVDYDCHPDAEIDDTSEVVITVRGGIADVERCPAGIDVEIVDFDNDPDAEIAADGTVTYSGE